MHISGEAGTGKSRVVEALKYLSASWGRREAISTVATTGIAAVLFNGETVHSKLLVKSRSISRGQEREEINQWSKVFMLMWDEISMTGQAYFAKPTKPMRRFLCTAQDEDPRVTYDHSR